MGLRLYGIFNLAGHFRLQSCFVLTRTIFFNDYLFKLQCNVSQDQQDLIREVSFLLACATALLWRKAKVNLSWKLQ